MKTNLDGKLSRLDKALTDIDHFVEANAFSASEGYMILKMRQDILKERRKVKNRIRSMSYREKNYTYTPRILTELFVAKEKGIPVYYK